MSEPLKVIVMEPKKKKKPIRPSVILGFIGGLLILDLLYAYGVLQ